MTGVDRLEVFVQTSPRTGALGGTVELRLDEPDGPVVGTSGTISPVEFDMRAMFGAPPATTPEEIKQRRRMGSQTVTIDLSSVSGIHDVYVIFRNADASEGRVISSLRELEFYGGK
jgi:cytochrome c